MEVKSLNFLCKFLRKVVELDVVDTVLQTWYSRYLLEGQQKGFKCCSFVLFRSIFYFLGGKRAEG